ncbi:sulfatase-like hydrolase/transferase [Orbaceae bacterium ESL0721]|nr:sulfatase-like hydrolase/transferase [Orbaceae bacterium ESL0721]
MRKLYLFILINLIISALIAIRYFLIPETSFSLLGIGFAFCAMVSNLFILYLLLFLVCLPLLLLNQVTRHIILSLILSLAQCLIFVDTIVFQQYRFHINQSVLSMVLSGQVVDFSILTYCLIGLLIFALFCVEYFTLFALNKFITKRYTGESANKRRSFPAIWFANCLLFLTLCISQFGHMVAFYYAYSPIMAIKEYVPLYYPLTSSTIMKMVDKDGERKVVYSPKAKNHSLFYPKAPLVINPSNKKPQNIMFIVLDSWRYDTFSPEISPNTYQFVKQNGGVIFNNHYSTGNATRTGIFGLFYGIPGTYWDAFLRNSIPSLFVTTLQKENYNIGIFTSAKVTAPEFDRTAFVTIDKLRINSEGNSASERDKVLTDDWLAWFRSRDQERPTFSFLFYDAPHGYDFPADFEVKFKPVGDLNYMTLNNETTPEPIFNRYKQSVYYDDHLLQQIYDELLASGTLDNTLIIITGDHGQEMNDNRLGFWGHNGNYTDAQTKVPFIVIGGKDSANLQENANKLTSHEDVVPSLMRHYLYVENDIRDYATGYDLFSPMPERNWLLMSNYSSYAVRTLDHIYLVNRIGVSHYMDAHNRKVDQTPNYQYIQSAIEQMRYFYKKSDSQ